MAELIIRLTDSIHPNPDKDLRGSFKRGFIQRVEEDGYPWRAKESIEVWVAEGHDIADWHGVTALIKIPGVPKADLEYLLQSLYDVVDNITYIARIRNWKANLGLLPKQIENAIDREFIYTVSESQWNLVIEHLSA